jgi:6-phosphogluconolactonase (cycloisomerase 2 family)
MYSQIYQKIKNLKTNIFMSTFSISDDSKFLATASYTANCVLIYDFKTGLLLKKINIFKPHATFIYKNWLLISSEVYKSIDIIVFNLNNFKISTQYNIKANYLIAHSNYFIAHSIHVNKDLLFISFCEGENKVGTVMSTKFNSLIGRINEKFQIIHKPFLNLGDTKGICTDEKNNFLFVTFESQPINFYNLLINRFKFFFLKNKFLEINNKSGIAIFKIYREGKISEKPLKIINFDKNSRLEDIQIYKNKLATVDLVNNIIIIYQFNNNLELKFIKKLSHNLNSPHSIRFYNNGKKLLVGNTNIKVINKIPQFWRYNKNTRNVFITYNLYNA